MVGKDGLYLLDLEQAVEGGDMAWDLAQFLYFSVRTARKEGGLRLITDAFLSAYRSENGSQTITRARRIRYLNPFFIFVSGRCRGR